MKRSSLVVVAFLSFLLSVRADTVAQWTFESSGLGSSTPSFQPGANSATTNFYAELGLQAGSAVAIGLHAGAATYTSPAGNGTTKSFSANTWAVGDYYQFQASSVGFQGISLSFDQTSSTTGPIGYSLDYSINGTSFTTFTGYTVRTNGANANNAGTGVATSGGWSSSTTQTGFSYLFDLSSVSSLDNQANIYFRLVDVGSINAQGNTVPATGTDRVDNFTITAIAVPEPSSLSLGLLGAFALFTRSIAKRRQ